jgi:DNA-3-methyladenine glycosylase|tara:strand:- start:4740 stop:5258 length:519 start_codon:yes stop_codon:yes gene_type:complete
MTEVIILPEYSTRIDTKFFARNSKTVAKDLLGRTLVREIPNTTTLYARIQEVAAYEGSQEDSMSKRVLSAPGTLIVSTKYGKRLLDIATSKIGKPSCITLIAATISDKRGKSELVHGPGNLTKILEIDKNYNGLPIELSPLWISGESIKEEKILKRNLSNLPKNCKGYFYFR